jgi:hypothetical protein
MFFSVCAASIYFNSRFGHIELPEKSGIDGQKFQRPAGAPQDPHATLPREMPCVCSAVTFRMTARDCRGVHANTAEAPRIARLRLASMTVLLQDSLSRDSLNAHLHTPTRHRFTAGSTVGWVAPASEDRAHFLTHAQGQSHRYRLAEV